MRGPPRRSQRITDVDRRPCIARVPDRSAAHPRREHLRAPTRRWAPPRSAPRAWRGTLFWIPPVGSSVTAIHASDGVPEDMLTLEPLYRGGHREVAEDQARRVAVIRTNVDLGGIECDYRVSEQAPGVSYGSRSTMPTPANWERWTRK